MQANADLVQLAEQQVCSGWQERRIDVVE